MLHECRFAYIGDHCARALMYAHAEHGHADEWVNLMERLCLRDLMVVDRSAILVVSDRY